MSVHDPPQARIEVCGITNVPRFQADQRVLQLAIGNEFFTMDGLPINEGDLIEMIGDVVLGAVLADFQAEAAR